MKKSKQLLPSKLLNSVFWILLLVLVGLTVVLRVWQFGQIPASLYIDEVAMLADAKALVSTGMDMHGNSWMQAIFPSYGDYKMPVYLWMVYAFSSVFSPSNSTVRLPSLLAGFGTIAIVYAFLRTLPSWKKGSDSKKYLSRKSAVLLVLVVVGCSPWAIQFSRTGFEAHLAQFLLASAITLLVVSKRRVHYLLVATALAVLATYTYFSVRYVWLPVYVVWVALQIQMPRTAGWNSKVKNGLIRLGQLVVPVIFFGLMLLPMLRSPLYQESVQFRLSTPSVLQNAEQVVQANQYREYAGNTVFDRLAFHRWYFTAQELGRNMSEQLSPQFLFVWGDANLRHGTGKYGLFVVPFLVSAVAGLYVLAKRNKRMLLLLATWIVASALPAAVPMEVPHALRFLNALVPLSVILAIGTYEIVVWLMRSSYSRMARLVALTLGATIVFFCVFSFACYYFSVYPQQSGLAWDREKTELAVAISPYLDGSQPVYVAHSFDKFFLWILAYGPYSGDEFNQWESDAYQFSTLGTVKMGLPSTFVAGDRVVLTDASLEKLLADGKLSVERFRTLDKIQLSTDEIYYTLEVVQ